MASNPFNVNVADLVHRPGARRHERIVGSLGGLRVMDIVVDPRADVAVDTVLEWVRDGILASGSASALWRGECRRCLKPVSGTANAQFRELFEPEPREGESYPLRHDHVDLAPMAGEALLLELPLAPICAEDCRGLCPLCGADRNETTCDCAPPDGDPRWAALDVLRRDSGQGPSGPSERGAQGE